MSPIYRRWEVRPHGPVPDRLDAGRLGSCSPMGGSADGCRSASWPDNSLGRWGVDFEQAGRADGAPDELAAAVRTDPVQDVLRAVVAPGALVRADKHVRRCRVQVPVAAFAIRPQLQHMTSIDRQPRWSNKRPSRYRPPSRRASPADVGGHRANRWSEASRTADLRYYGFVVAANTLSNNADRRSLVSATIRDLCEHDPGGRR
jgi:hypothetical protein